MDPWLVERVLTCVDQVPRGRVVSYGDIGGLVGVGPRQVGAVMSTHGGGVTWWRVVSAAGRLPDHLLADARAHWAEEGIEVRSSRAACRIERCRADLGALATAYDLALTRLGPH